MLHLQSLGCANIEAVSPSHQLPWFLEALSSARANGLDLPIVYNTNGYEAPETLEILEGIVDVYLPDLKYASDECASRYSDTPDYVRVARQAVSAMHSQVGNLVVDLSGRAVRGLIIRLLVLPNGIAGIQDSLLWIRDHFPATVTLSIMSQYTPIHHATRYPELNRTVTEHEYDAILEEAWDLGFQNIYIQDMTSSRCGIPDFSSDRPFSWDDI
jgi:putative pyruvate formate lyase activating enzyme